MNIIDAISNRRSIRKFIDREIDRSILEKILKAAINAPSPKNIQPWKFVVITKESKGEMFDIINKVVNTIKSKPGSFANTMFFLSSAEQTIKIMEEAPVIIIVINTGNKHMSKQTPAKRYKEMTHILSCGASIENMLLASLEYGIGSLWISDIFFFARELAEWLDTDKQIVAAIALGYPADNPTPPSRKEMDALVEWR